MKIKIALAISALLLASAARADEIFTFNWTDTVTEEGTSATESLSGQLVWDATTGTVSQITTDMSGTLLVTESLSATSAGLDWVLTGASTGTGFADGTDTITFLLFGGSLDGNWVSSDFGEDQNQVYWNAPQETDPVGTEVPEPPLWCHLAMAGGILMLAGGLLKARKQ
jgi:hypothetical protein